MKILFYFARIQSGVLIGMIDCNSIYGIDLVHYLGIMCCCSFHFSAFMTMQNVIRIKQYTEEGFKKSKVPKKLWNKILQFREEQIQGKKWVRGTSTT